MSSQTIWREWELEGLDVSLICFSYSVYIDMRSAECSLSLTIESSFTLCSTDGQISNIDPEKK